MKVRALTDRRLEYASIGHMGSHSYCGNHLREGRRQQKAGVNYFVVQAFHAERMKMIAAG